MIVDGKKLADEIFADIKARLAGQNQAPCLTVFTCAPTAETRKYLELKQRRAAANGIDVALLELEANVTIEEVEKAIDAASVKSEGIIVQLPFPPQIDVERLIKAVPSSLDVDALSYEGKEAKVLPPVVGAVATISEAHDIGWNGKTVAVVGQGRLVGRPAALWAKAQGALVTIIDKNTPDADELLLNADIIVSGVGSPGLITPDKIKEGVIIFDAGTSEEGGQLKGDADPACSGKAALFTPVPGGIGPITIALLFRNLLVLAGK
jgi:methylenetetrahydrofolate dehydrogenase (NADP+)/methenyltetrahydrofolate cyclohydrolase